MIKGFLSLGIEVFRLISRAPEVRMPPRKERRALQFPQAASAEDCVLGAGQGTQEMGALSSGIVAALRNFCDSEKI